MKPRPIGKPSPTQLRITIYKYDGGRRAFKYTYVWGRTVYGLTPAQARTRIIKALRA